MTDGPDFLDRLADALGVGKLAAGERAGLLDLARVVAHGTERRHAPVATYLAGLATAGGTPPADVLATVQRLLDQPRPA
ncbi:MAG: DUF6457 domain-containing protein [Acidimicrobiales bacterium]